MKHKILILIGIITILFIGLMSIQGIVKDRILNQETAISSIEKSNASAQTIMGPIIIIDYNYQVEALEVVGEERHKKMVTQNRTTQQIILPTSLNVTGNVDVSERVLGIFSTNIFNADLNFTGQFPEYNLTPPENYIPGSLKTYARIFIKLSDTKGIRKHSPLKLQGKTLEFDAATHLGGVGIASPLEAIDQTNQTFEFQMTLSGTQKLQIIPVGKNSEMSITSNWKDPNFTGTLPPVGRTITHSGFNATWSSNWVANNIKTNIEHKNFNQLDSFDMSFINVLDHYQLTERSIKYGLLFIVLTFTAFYFFEIIKKAKVHPIQYTLVGMALVVFYILVLALSEYISFGLSYLSAALACIALIALYCHTIFNDRKLVLAFSALLASIYGVWYFILNSEQIALLAGAIFIFAILALVMFMTRRINWYQLHMPSDIAKDA